MAENERQNYHFVIFQFTMKCTGEQIHFPREVWACIMSYNNQSRQIESLQRSLNASNEFGDVVIDNLERSQRINETLYFQLRKLRRKYNSIKRKNRVLIMTIQNERALRIDGVPMIARAEDSMESGTSDSDSDTIIEISDNEEVNV